MAKSQPGREADDHQCKDASAGVHRSFGCGQGLPFKKVIDMLEKAQREHDDDDLPELPRARSALPLFTLFRRQSELCEQQHHRLPGGTPGLSDQPAAPPPSQVSCDGPSRPRPSNANNVRCCRRSWNRSTWPTRWSPACSISSGSEGLPSRRGLLRRRPRGRTVPSRPRGKARPLPGRRCPRVGRAFGSSRYSARASWGTISTDSARSRAAVNGVPVRRTPWPSARATSRRRSRPEFPGSNPRWMLLLGEPGPGLARRESATCDIPRRHLVGQVHETGIGVDAEDHPLHHAHARVTHPAIGEHADHGRWRTPIGNR